MIGRAVRIRRAGLLELEHETLVEYWLVFTPAATVRWWSRFLAPGFGHVYALRWSPRGWLRLDPGMDFLRLEFVDAPVYASPRQFTEPGARLVRVEARIRPETMRAPWIWSPVTCVEAVKALLGIRRFWLWTPQQLFRHLGGRP